MAANEKEMERAAELLLKMTQEQRRDLFDRIEICGRCFSTTCVGWCDYETPR